jgi:hypothetical protein
MVLYKHQHLTTWLNSDFVVISEFKIYQLHYLFNYSKAHYHTDELTHYYPLSLTEIMIT